MEDNNNWFKIKVRYLHQNEKGEVKNKSEEYVLKAVSFSDAEFSIRELLMETIPEFNIKTCATFNLQDVIKDETKEAYFKVKLVYVSTNEAGKETKIIENYLVHPFPYSLITTKISTNTFTLPGNSFMQNRLITNTDFFTYPGADILPRPATFNQ